MAKADWVRKFNDRIEEAIDGLDDDSLAEDINDAVDWKEMIQEALSEDPQIKKKLQAKIVEMLESYIENAEGFGELVGDEDFNIFENLPNELDLKQIVFELLEPGAKLRKMLEAKLVELIEGQMENTEDLEELTGDSEFNWLEYLPEEMSVGSVVTEIFQADEGLAEAVREKIKQLIIEKLDELDDEAMPEWEEFLPLLKIEKHIQQLLAENPDLQETLCSKIKELTVSQIENSLDEDDLPENFLETLNFEAELKEILADRDFRASMSENLKARIRALVTGLVEGGDLGELLQNKLQANMDFVTLLDREVDALMRNREFLISFSERLRGRMEKDARVSELLMSAFFQEVAKTLVAKLMKGV